MAFGATMTVTISGVDRILNRINQDNYGSEYKASNATEKWRALIRHSSRIDPAYGKMLRHNIEFTFVVKATLTTPEYITKLWHVIEHQESDDPALILARCLGWFGYAVATQRTTDLIAELN